MSAWTWLVAVIWCPVAALVGGIVVAVQTQDFVVGVIGGIAGLVVGFVVAAVMGVITEVVADWPTDHNEHDVSDPDKTSGSGLMLRRKFGVREAIEMVIVVPFVLVAFLGAPVAALAATIVAGSRLGG